MEETDVDQFRGVIVFSYLSFDNNLITNVRCLGVVKDENAIPGTFTILDEIADDSRRRGSDIVRVDNSGCGD